MEISFYSFYHEKNFLSVVYFFFSCRKFYGVFKWLLMLPYEAAKRCFCFWFLKHTKKQKFLSFKENVVVVLFFGSSYERKSFKMFFKSLFILIAHWCLNFAETFFLCSESIKCYENEIYLKKWFSAISEFWAFCCLKFSNQNHSSFFKLSETSAELYI